MLEVSKCFSKRRMTFYSNMDTIYFSPKNCYNIIYITINYFSAIFGALIFIFNMELICSSPKSCYNIILKSLRSPSNSLLVKFLKICDKKMKYSSISDLFNFHPSFLFECIFVSVRK